MRVASAPPTWTRSSPSGSAPRQTRTNALFSHSQPIVVSSVWPGKTFMSGGRPMRTSITERRRSSKASRVPPTEPAKSVSPVKQTSSLKAKVSMPGLCPGVRSASMRRSPVSITSPCPTGSAPATSSAGSATTVTPKRFSSSSWWAMWSEWACVVRRCVTCTSSRSTAAMSGSIGAPLSTKTAVPPARSATR
jgi:hypothetical protein